MLPTVQVETERAVVALGAFRLLPDRQAMLLQQLGNAQLQSVYKTFEEEGSPAGSWVPLAPSTIKRNPRVYGPGHKLLILSGRLRNSIRVYDTAPNEVALGTNLVYAAVHQYGSADRSVAIGPKTEGQANYTVRVRGYAAWRRERELGLGTDKEVYGDRRRRKIQGPRNARQVITTTHRRHQNIPPRPYLVFRPEDPEKLQGVAERFLLGAARSAGLETA
jgi:phage gpG-like protein